ncbi:MAG: hypothetical protein CL489_08565 [Acidobacteria bacterium]|nr:hypothetical protein [Acidobacteriota bacterium]|tara:strand:- start:41079 stop:41489 length:411 start_codon:yes stop_codon:yes gene_type:complete
MSKPKPVKTFAIRHKETGEYFLADSGKNAWRSIGAAKNAFAYHGASRYYRSDEKVIDICKRLKVKPIKKLNAYNEYEYRVPYFDEQDVWEIVELSAKVEDCGKRLKQAEKLLQSIYDYGYYEEKRMEVENFLFNEK